MTINDEKYSERDKKLELLEEKLKNFESIKTELEDYTDKLGKLYQAGIIDEDGNIVSNKNQTTIIKREQNWMIPTWSKRLLTNPFCQFYLLIVLLERESDLHDSQIFNAQFCKVVNKGISGIGYKHWKNCLW